MVFWFPKAAVTNYRKLQWLKAPFILSQCRRPEGCSQGVGGAASSGGCGGGISFLFLLLVPLMFLMVASFQSLLLRSHCLFCLFSSKDTCVVFRAYLDNSDDLISRSLITSAQTLFPSQVTFFVPGNVVGRSHSTLHRWLVASHFLWTLKFPLHLTLFCKPVFPPMPGGGLSGDGLYPGPPRDAAQLHSYFLICVEC